MRDEHSLPWLAAPLAQWRDEARGHALILHGGAGSGVLELAVRLAQAWLCESPPGPCDQCPSCHLVRQMAHTDLKLLMPETWQQALALGEPGEPEASSGDTEGGKSKRKPSKEIRVEAIRQAIDWAHTTSGRSRGKVLILFPADAMNTVSANALLKTLEEPAAGLRLLLCVDDPERLLPTIRSRCQRLRLEPPDLATSVAWLAAQGLPDAEWLLKACGDEPLAAEQAAAKGLTAAIWTALPKQVAAGDGRALLAMEVPAALRCLQQICHDVMVRRAGGLPRFFPAECLPQGGDWSGLAAWSQALSKAVRQQDHPWNAGLFLESLLAAGRQALQASAPTERRAGRVGTLRA